MFRNKLLILFVFSVFCLDETYAGVSNSYSSLHRVCVQKSADLSKVLAGENTRYIIRHDYDLSKCKDGIVIGANSVLEF